MNEFNFRELEELLEQISMPNASINGNAFEGNRETGGNRGQTTIFF